MASPPPVAAAAAKDVPAGQQAQFDRGTSAESSGSSRRYGHHHATEHLDENSLRVKILHFINSSWFEKAMGFVVLMNFLIIIVEVDREALCYPLPAEFQTVKDCKASLVGVLSYIVRFLLFVYTIECGGRVYAERCEFFKRAWNLLDLFVVITGWFSEGVSDIGSMSSLRIIRTLRLLRLFRVLIAFEEMYLLLSGLLSTCKSLVFASMMLFALLTVWSVIVVEHIHPIASEIDWEAYGCERCGRGYSTILHSNLTLFQQLVTGDSWGGINIPVIEAAPWAAAILMAIVVSVSLGFMNLMLAVIIQRAQDARESDGFARAMEKEREQEVQIKELMGFCKVMDEDGSGHIDLEELLKAQREDEEVKALFRLMDIHEEELRTVFKVLDTDGSGEISYMEFCQEIYKIRTRDVNTMLSFMKIEMHDVNKRLMIMEANLHTHMNRVESHVMRGVAQETVVLQQTMSSPSPLSPGQLFSGDSSPPASQVFAAPFANAADGPIRDLDLFKGMDYLKISMLGRLEEQVESLVEALREDLNDVSGSRVLEKKSQLVAMLSDSYSDAVAMKLLAPPEGLGPLGDSSISTWTDVGDRGGDCGQLEGGRPASQGRPGDGASLGPARPGDLVSSV